MLITTVLLSMFSMYLWVEATYVVPTYDDTLPVGIITTECNSKDAMTTCAWCGEEGRGVQEVFCSDVCLTAYNKDITRDAELAEQERIDAILEAGSSCYWCNGYLPDSLSDCPRCNTRI